MKKRSLLTLNLVLLLFSCGTPATITSSIATTDLSSIASSSNEATSGHNVPAPEQTIDNPILRTYYEVYSDNGGILDYQSWITSILSEEEERLEIKSIESVGEWIYIMVFGDDSSKTFSIYNFKDPLFFGVDQTLPFEVIQEDTQTIVKYCIGDSNYANARTVDDKGSVAYKRTIKVITSGKETSVSYYEYDNLNGVYLGIERTDYGYEREGGLDRLYSITDFEYDKSKMEFTPANKVLYRFKKGTDELLYCLNYIYLDGEFSLSSKDVYENGEIAATFDYVNIPENNRTKTSVTYAYDEKGNVTEIITSNLNTVSNLMVPTKKTTFAYDTYGNETENTEYSYKNDEYVATRKKLATYNENGEILSSRSYYSKVVDNKDKLVGSSGFDNSYDSDGRLTETISYSWNENSSSWDTSNITSIKYEAIGSTSLVTTTKNNLLSGSSTKEEVHTNKNGEDLKRTFSTFDKDLKSWKITNEKIWEYNSDGNETLYLSTQYTNEEAIVREKNIIEYNSLGQRVKEETYDNRIDTEGLQVKPRGTVTRYSYNDEGKLTSKNFSRYIKDPNSIKLVTSYEYEYYSKGNLKSEIARQYDEYGEYIEKNVTIYDEDDNVILVENYWHDSTNDEYQINSRIEKSYADGILRFNRYETFSFSHRVYDSIYDQNGNLIKKTTDTFTTEEYEYGSNNEVILEAKYADYSGENGAPIDSTKVKKTYDESGNVILENHYVYNTKTNLWSSYTIEYIYTNGQLIEEKTSTSSVIGEWVERS